MEMEKRPRIDVRHVAKRGPSVPSYRLHRPSGRADVTLSGQDHNLDAHGSPESKTEYDRLVAEWLLTRRPTRGGQVAEPLVSDVILAFWQYVKEH